MSDIKTAFAENLQILRKEAHITQSELAEKLNYSDKAISKWERGDSLPDVTVLKQIANLVYNTSGLNVETTIVNGEILMENKQIKHIDVDNIIRNVNKMNN